jgi:hypothetical protein
MKSFYIAYMDLIVVVSNISADSIERFFYAPIWLCGSRVCSLAVSAIWFNTTLFKILLSVFFRVIKW